MCHSNNVVIYRVVFGPERMTYSVKESYYWSYLQLTKLYICTTLLLWHIYTVVFGPERITYSVKESY